MRVLITGVTEQSGRTVARLLLAAGHEVVGMAAQPHRYLDPRVELVLGDPGDETVCARAVADCTSVVHLAWTPSHRRGAERANVVAAAAVGAAARQAGARIVLPSTTEVYGVGVGGPDGCRIGTDAPLAPAGAEGRQRAAAEQAIRGSGADVLVVRAAPLAGRRADATSCRTLASLLHTMPGDSWQLLHPDDLERFLVHAAAGDRTGVVHLAAAGVVTRDDARRALRDAGATASVRGIPSNSCPPLVDTSATTEQWGFRCGWSAAEVVADLARGLVGRKPGRGGARTVSGEIPLPSHLIAARVPASDGHPLEGAAPQGLEGEFDDRFDDRFPVYTATNTSEALPGPMTPLTLDLHVAGVRLANERMGWMLAFEGLAMEQWTSRVVSVFGHHVYINASVGVLTAENMPGWDEDSIRADVYGNIPADVEMLPHGRPPMPRGLAKAGATATVLSRVIATARRYRATTDLISTASRKEALDAEQIAALTDEQLYAKVMLWRDRLGQAWSAAAIGVMMTGAASAIHERSKAGGDVGIDLETLESARTMLAVERLAGHCRADAKLLALAKAGDVAGARAASALFAEALDEALACIGHRGPGECELANPVFADRPGLLVTAAANAAQQPAPTRTPARPGTGRTARMAAGATVARERARDGVVRINHCLRLAARELAGRHMGAGLDRVDDAFYLTLDELLHLPADARERVARRRAEREKLRGFRMPNVIVGRWEPVTGVEPLAVSESLTGLGVSPGVVEGRVRRVLSVDDDIEPGEVLVASVTDTGHTAMFAYAAAVVTDIGGAASHAAIVAREFQIPCVVDTQVASTKLADGQLVRVDGAAGTVTLLDDRAGLAAAEPVSEESTVGGA